MCVCGVCVCVCSHCPSLLSNDLLSIQARLHEIADVHESQASVLSSLLKQPLPEESEKRTYLENLKNSEVSYWNNLVYLW
jgi:hypothetical protein